MTDFFGHCKERMQARYEVPFMRADWDEINRRCLYENNVKFLFQPNAITSIYSLDYRGRPIGVMFSETHRVCTTILPPEDIRLSGLKPDGSKPRANYQSNERAHRLAAIHREMFGDG